MNSFFLEIPTVKTLSICLSVCLSQYLFQRRPTYPNLIWVEVVTKKNTHVRFYGFPINRVITSTIVIFLLSTKTNKPIIIFQIQKVLLAGNSLCAKYADNMAVCSAFLDALFSANSTDHDEDNLVATQSSEDRVDQESGTDLEDAGASIARTGDTVVSLITQFYFVYDIRFVWKFLYLCIYFWFLIVTVHNLRHPLVGLNWPKKYGSECFAIYRWEDGIMCIWFARTYTRSLRCMPIQYCASSFLWKWRRWKSCWILQGFSRNWRLKVRVSILHFLKNFCFFTIVIINYTTAFDQNWPVWSSININGQWYVAMLEFGKSLGIDSWNIFLYFKLFFRILASQKIWWPIYINRTSVVAHFK